MGWRHGVVQGARILIVDDDASIRGLVQQVLAEEQYQTSTAATGREALSRIEESSPPPDLIILDLLMPEMSGWDVLEYLRANAMQQLPVLILSAQRPDSSILEA